MSLYNSLNKKKLTVITNGDSWTFGSEIVAPEISAKYPNAGHVCEYDYFEENDGYRVPKVWPSQLGNILNADVVNLAWPADDNTSILRRTISYITTNYIAKNLPTDNLLVIIGWSSPERNSFWYKDEDTSMPFRLQPQVPNFTSQAQKKFWELYVAYLWNVEEYISRFVFDTLQFENFCRRHNIKFLQFNAFYQTPQQDIDRWTELNIDEEVKQLKLHGYAYADSNHSSVRQHDLTEYYSLWDTVDLVRFYKKNQTNNTFKGFIDSTLNEDVYCGWHPSPQSHNAWAKELADYLKKNNIL